MINVESDNLAFGIKIDNKSLHDLPGFCAGRTLQFDIEAIRLGIIVQLHHVLRGGGAGTQRGSPDGGDILFVGTALEHT